MLQYVNQEKRRNKSDKGTVFNYLDWDGKLVEAWMIKKLKEKKIIRIY